MDEASELKARFLELLGPDNAASYPYVLEQDFPHVFKTIVSLWGTTKMDEYFEEILVTRRDDRKGFPAEAASEILRLFSLYSDLGLAKPAYHGLSTAWTWLK